MSNGEIELFQFLRSHYNEKARWALDWKGIPHTRTNLLPGPHQRAVRKMAPASTVPLLRLGDEFVQGSDRILAVLEERFPEPALLPDDPKDRERALEIQRFFDEEIGPSVRQALFSKMLDHGRYVCSTFDESHSAPMRVMYRAIFPVAKRMIAREYDIANPVAIEAEFAATERGLDFVAREASVEGYLVGDRFGLADLVAASLLSICADPQHPDMRRPEPIPHGVREWLDHWAAHPGTAWVMRTYERHRAESPPA